MVELVQHRTNLMGSRALFELTRPRTSLGSEAISRAPQDKGLAFQNNGSVSMFGRNGVTWQPGPAMFVLHCSRASRLFSTTGSTGCPSSPDYHRLQRSSSLYHGCFVVFVECLEGSV